MKKLLQLTALCVVLAGCGTPAPEPTDPTERGLTKIALAIVGAAFVRGIMNK